jgi:hypothetical protein
VDVCGTTTLCDPERPSAPLQAPDAEHEDACVDDQVSVTGGPPGTPTSVTELVSVTVGVTRGDDPPSHAAVATAITAVMATLQHCDRIASPPVSSRDLVRAA